MAERGLRRRRPWYSTRCVYNNATSSCDAVLYVLLFPLFARDRMTTFSRNEILLHTTADSLSPCTAHGTCSSPRSIRERATAAPHRGFYFYNRLARVKKKTSNFFSFTIHPSRTHTHTRLYKYTGVYTRLSRVRHSCTRRQNKIKDRASFFVFCTKQVDLRNKKRKKKIEHRFSFSAASRLATHRGGA